MTEWFLKVLNAKHDGASSFAFECRDIETRQRQVVQCQLLGLFEALDSAAPFMKNPKDILLTDLDNEGRWKVIPQVQVCSHLLPVLSPSPEKVV